MLYSAFKQIIEIFEDDLATRESTHKHSLNIFYIAHMAVKNINQNSRKRFYSFKDRFISGRKKQTIRRANITPPEAGDVLYLTSNKLELIDRVVCIDVKKVEINIKNAVVILDGKHVISGSELDTFSKNDGFKNVSDFFSFFCATNDIYRGYLITW